MISLDKFLSCLSENAARIHDYELGKDGRDGTSDCVGFIIGALRLAGEKYSSTHGSNYFARYYTNNLREIHSELDDLHVGDVVYKAYEPGDPKYNLPSRYELSGDLLDYYHIGAVMSVNPLMIWHCSNGGMHHDTKIGKWRYCGEVKTVFYSDEEEPMETPYIAEVAIKSGSLNVRSGPSTSDAIIGKLQKGARVTVQVHGDDWDFVSSGLSGYVANRYLRPIEEAKPTPAPDEENVVISVPKTVIQNLVTALKDFLEYLQGF